MFVPCLQCALYLKLVTKVVSADTMPLELVRCLIDKLLEPPKACRAVGIGCIMPDGLPSACSYYRGESRGLIRDSAVIVCLEIREVANLNCELGETSKYG